MKRSRFKYCIFPRYRWYISGQFIWDYMLDRIHHYKGLPPIRGDAVTGGCGKKYCRYCGGTVSIKK